ncbi:plastocyanin/azurin family copper-binding protein [Halobacteria archaeon AArc-dxtr1]|nr:plastocyanin/azurin family copper-binding protein [Halobacteria archaeon AArc-dxtr1]
MSGRWTTRRRLLATGGATLTAGVAGCLDESPGEDDPQLGDPEPHVDVEVGSDAAAGHLDPAAIHLVEGGTVEWVVETGSQETVAYHPATHGEQRRIPDDADPWVSGPLSEGETFGRTFDVEGVYDYACRTHESEGAVGSIVVGWPNPDEQPGLGSPSEEYPDAAIDALRRHDDRVREFLEDTQG